MYKFGKLKLVVHTNNRDALKDWWTNYVVCVFYFASNLYSVSY
jgi:hypothetical protein